METKLSNYKETDTPMLWQRAKQLSLERGKFVKTLLSQATECKNKIILDAGCGVGGTSIIFSEDNFVISTDRNISNLKEINQTNKLQVIQSDLLNLPIRSNLIDIIILQDVIEHLEECPNIAETFAKILKQSGKIFLSTPSKFSVFNFIADPHWGFPFVSILKRKTLRKYFLPLFSKKDINRKGIAQLYSLKEIVKLFEKDFEIKLYTSFVVHHLFKNEKGILWSNFHLFLLQICKPLKLNLAIQRIANDKSGFLNKYITPTFYFILTRK